jgi:nicotinamide-nucleotide amidase
MRNMVTKEVLPRILNTFDLPVIVHRMVNTVGIGESWLSELIAEWEDQLPPHLKLAYLPDPGIVKLRITASGDDREILEKDIDFQVDLLQKIAGKYIFSFGRISLKEAVGKLLSEREETISTAESCSGGYLAHKFTSVPGSSRYFTGSVVAYDNQVKISQLTVPPEILKEYGAVSKETVQYMAENVRKLFNTSYGLATSGIAGPDGGTPEKPVGTVWLALSDSNKTITRKLNLGNDRLLNIHLSAIYSLDLLRQSLFKITGE